LKEKKYTKQTNLYSCENSPVKLDRVIYPGSFDPVTFGHVDIIKRAADMYSEVIVAVLNNQYKTSLFSIDERVKMLEEVIEKYPNVRVDSYCGLTIDYARKHNIHVLIRGLRAVTDFEYELQIAQTNRKLSHETVDTVFLTTSLENAYLSSTIVKEIACYKGDISQCVPKNIMKKVYKKYNITLKDIHEKYKNIE
jgi:pantetheine-phosphate adenylyltransferase